MYWSKLFIPTLRETPAEAEVASHQLLLRAGYIRQLGTGIYSHLLLAQRSLRKVAAIVREEMNAIGGQEILLPALHPGEVWRESGRWDVMGDNLFRMRDRWGRDLCLGMTHEEVVTLLARGELRSYKQLPQIWYQLQTKFRDEPRPKSGLLRIREFLMKDSYSFDMDAAGLDAAYRKHYDAYCRIFDRCGLRYVAVEAHSGTMGAGESHEFVVASEAGEDLVAMSPGGYAANLEKAVSRPVPPAAADTEGDLAPEEFYTPNRKTIADVAEFTGLPETSQMKSLVLVANGQPVLALVRGDHTLSDSKFAAVAGAQDARAAQPDEIREWFGADPGSLGPIGVRNMRVIADVALRGRRNMICGANRNDFHMRNVTPGEDFEPEWADIRQVVPGDADVNTGEPLEILKAVEIGHIFKLGQKYSEPMGLRVLDENGKEVVPVMGSYGIGLERILACAVELYHDQDGISLPASIAPFAAVITPANWKDEAQRECAARLYRECGERGIDALLDDRDERPGVKFKDADLIGVPYRITVGKKLAQGQVEVVERRSRKATDVAAEGAVAFIAERLHA